MRHSISGTFNGAVRVIPDGDVNKAFDATGSFSASFDSTIEIRSLDHAAPSLQEQPVNDPNAPSGAD